MIARAMLTGASIVIMDEVSRFLSDGRDKEKGNKLFLLLISSSVWS